MSQAQDTEIEIEQFSKKIVNDFSITFGTVNGSGSATANQTMLRAIFKMGIPVAGKNIFPSNIQGMPTWYTIRVSAKSYLGRKKDRDIVVGMNQQSFSKDMASVRPGGVFLYDDRFNKTIEREDIIAYPMDIKTIMDKANPPKHLKSYLTNMVYIGILCELLGCDLKKIKNALDFHFKTQKKPVQLNLAVVESAVDWAKENLVKRDPYYLEPADKTDGFVLANGNTAGALGTIFGGIQFSAWYPITPATSLPEMLSEQIPIFRKEMKSGRATYAIVQAEDELSAIGMSIGAGWAGLRSMTATSGAGISLMAEYLGLAYAAEIPVVVWNVQRMGPSTGLPTRTSQGDLTFSYFLSQGDTNYIILIPATPNECFEFGWRSFDFAEKYQTPVLVMSDLDLGMNQWMTEEFTYPDKPMERGKILWEEDFEKIWEERKGDWGRYLDIDGDGIPYRTLPGNTNKNSGYFGRGTGHDEYTNYSEDPEVWERTQKRLRTKVRSSKKELPEPILRRMEDADFGLISMGSADQALLEAQDALLEKGYRSDYLRIRSIPFSEDVFSFIKKHSKIFIVEMNDEGQLTQLITLETPENAAKLVKVTKNDGFSITANFIVGKIIDEEKKNE
ncbi:MAG: 2-oxoacid:acceptor oxidoreductase subunit alpha [Anaerolineaceae bacterium]|nr:2-oxoacid:acceptor oxidoreductase subunit alpha [Anaerolineaceae bacterium]